MIEPNYVFKATVNRVIDGDTLVMTVSPAFKIQLVDYKFRLFGVDTPELNATDPEARVLANRAKEFVEQNVLGKEVLVKAHKNNSGAEKIDSFGRYLAEILFFDENGAQVNLNQRLIDNGLASEYRR